MIESILLGGLWQGAIVFGIAVLAMLCIPRRNASTRYAFWFVALLALAIVPLASQWHPIENPGPLPTAIAHTVRVTSAATARASGPWLTILWLAGVVFGATRLSLSYIRIARIVRNATPAPQYGLDVLISDEITLPIAAGLLAPAIVIPRALASSLEPADLQAVIGHERAHVARYDIATNFVQCVVEACLFFNPWVYLTARQLIAEREAACDDRVVTMTGEAGRYATCLAALATRASRAQAPLFTPSAIGSPHVLVVRIARLLNGKAAQVKINYLIVGSGVAAFAILAFALQTVTGLAANGLVPGADQSATPNPNFPPKCFADVKVINPAQPNIPKDSYMPNADVDILVTVDATGKPVSAMIGKVVGGNKAIVKASIGAAMASTYSPELYNCKPKTGTYMFHVETGPPQP